jgi:putative phosphoribosyl transferase
MMKNVLLSCVLLTSLCFAQQQSQSPPDGPPQGTPPTFPREDRPQNQMPAKALNAPLDMFLVRRLGVPGQEEVAMGAIATGGVQILNNDVIGAVGITQEEIDSATEWEEIELQRRERKYGGGHEPLDIRGKICILVDDGLATGSTMRAAIAAMRNQQPTRVIVGVPVTASSTCTELQRKADEVVCLVTPEHFAAVGQWYLRFGETTDAEVRNLLEKSAAQFRRTAA